MISTAPPPCHSHARSTARRDSPPDCSCQPGCIHWRVVLASVFGSIILVAGVFAWIVTHPHKAASPLPSIRLAAVEMPVIPLEPQALPQTPVYSMTPVFQHTPREERVPNVPSVELNSPPLSLPALQQPQPQESSNDESMSPTQLPPTPKEPTGESYGTQVLFLNNQENAADLARHEHKLMFVMHISGNFEDSCFT